MMRELVELGATHLKSSGIAITFDRSRARNQIGATNSAQDPRDRNELRLAISPKGPRGPTAL